MAEGGVEEMAKAYQTATEKMCELCLDEDSFKQATWYCKQCRQRLCDRCRKYHRKVASAKDHEVVRAEEMSPFTPHVTEDLSDELRMPMCNTHNLPIEIYCEYHNQPVCNSCKLVDHRKCLSLKYLKHIATESADKSSEVLQHVEDIAIGLRTTEDALTKESISMEEQKEQIINRIKGQIQEIEDLGHKKISEIEMMFEKEQTCIHQDTGCIKQTQLLVSKSIDEIKTAKQNGSEEELFLAASHVEREAGKYQDILKETSHITQREVKLNDTLRLNDIESSWNIEFKKCKVDVDSEPRATEFLNTNSSEKIFWIDILPGKQVIVLIHEETQQSDHTQHGDHLSLYSRRTGLLFQLDLPGDAVSADTMNDHQVIVALPGKQFLQTVDIVNDKLVLKNTIQTTGNPWLILKYSEQSVIVFAQHMNGTFCFNILGLGGNVLMEIPINESLKNPLFMRMSKEGDIIYIIDLTSGCYGFNLKGDKRFYYTQENAKQYAGLAIDHHNCVHLRIDDEEGKHLTKLSPAGQRIQSICRDYGWPMRCDRTKMYLAYMVPKSNDEKVICSIYV